MGLKGFSGYKQTVFEIACFEQAVYLFDRIQLRGIGQQAHQVNTSTSLFFEEHFDSRAPVNSCTVQKDKQLLALESFKQL